MALQLTGPINMQDLSVEFGGTGALSLDQYYRGGARVPNASANINVPTSGAISLGNFYGATRRIEVTVTIASNQTNYVFNTAKVPGYVAGITDVTFVINSGVVLSASSTGSYAGNVDTSWAAGDTVRIINNGFIVGMGGSGGKGASTTGTWPANYVPAVAGSPGGPAFIAQRSVSFNNQGTIGGGGGGGGGGSSSSVPDFEGSFTYITGGGGGGGGRSGSVNSAGGLGGTRGDTGTQNGADGNPGSPGTFSSQGAGGAARSNPFLAGPVSGAGGSGGTWGAAGNSGGADNTGINRQNVGGSAGAAIAGNANITWLATGTRLGAIG